MKRNNKKRNVKNSIREITILLLWILAVILILGVLLYQYVPVNKIIPETISYTTPEEVKAELQNENSSENAEEDTLPLKYNIDATELNNYKKIQEYVPGKKNPFASITQNDSQNSESESTENTKTENNTGANSGSNSNTNSINTSGETTNSTNYLPDKGTK